MPIKNGKPDLIKFKTTEKEFRDERKPMNESVETTKFRMYSY